MMKLRRNISIGCAISLSTVVFGCGGGSSDGPSMIAERSGPARSQFDGGVAPGRHVVSQEAVGLRLSDQRADRLAGTYVSERDPKIGLRFASEKKDETIAWSLIALDGRELIRVQGGAADGMILRYGEITLRMAPALVADAIASRQGQGPPSTFPEPVLSREGRLTNGGAVVEGDLAKFAEADGRPELALLPELSRALGDRGLTGDKLPAALPLHAFAMTFATSSPAFKRAALSMTGEGAFRESALSAMPSFICTPGDVECCSRKPDDPGCKPEPPKPPPGPDRCQGREPRGDSCYGMCGPGCTCWPNVCGDCCYHPGCAIHDDWCRACEDWNPLACIACYGPTALVGVVAC
jgi:hypothetical protein